MTQKKPHTQRDQRKYFTKRRRQLTESQRKRMANQAARQLHHHFLSRHHQHIGIYLDDFGELPTLPLFQWAKKQQKTLYLPVVKGKNLKFRQINYAHLRTKRFARHHFGMKEPKSGRLISVETLDILFLPLVAADKQGNRMGMGGGFYDRTLAQLAKHATTKKVITTPLRVGWAYDFQLVSSLDHHSWDVPLHRLITPSKIHRF